MLIRKEEQESIKGLADLLDYFALVDDGVLLLSTGVYLAGWEISGPDMDGMELHDSWALSDRIAKKLHLGTGWTVESNLMRGEYQEYAPVSTEWPDPVSALIDDERRERFLLKGECSTRLSRYYLTLAYEPALKQQGRAARWMFSQEDGRPGPGEKALKLFSQTVLDFEMLLAANLPGVRRLKSYTAPVGGTEMLFCDLLRYVRRCTSGEDYPFAVPESPMFLNQYMASDDFTGGEEPELGAPRNPTLRGKQMAILSIDGFPKLSYAGILRELDALPFDFRFGQQGQVLSELEGKAEHEANRDSWSGKKTTYAQKFKATPPPRVDGVAAELEDDAARAATLAEYGRETNLRYNAKIIVLDPDPDRLREAVEAIARTVKFSCGFNCRLETVNAVAAWLGSLPGMQYKDVRKFVVTADNFVHMMPLSAPFRGRRFNPSKLFPPQSPPLFYGVTAGGAPYRFHAHVQDVGHSLIVGPNGSGKTVWIAFAIAQFFRFPNAQVFAFDKKRTLYTLCKAIGGDFYDISPDGDTRLCPLHLLETGTDRSDARQLVELLLVQNDVPVTPAMRISIAEAIDDLALSPRRSLTDFQMAVTSQPIKDGLEVYRGGILDGERDGISMSRFSVFEMDELYRLDKKTMNGALFSIFSRIRRRLRSDIPTLVTVDEFREALEHPMAAKYFDEFLFEGRKLNMAVWIVLQELSKALNSPLKGAILEQCFTKICLANPQAVLEAEAAYQKLGLNKRDCEYIAHAQPKAHYYVTSPDGKRMIALELGAMVLSFVASSGDLERAMVDRLVSQYGPTWPVAWLKARGLEDWAARLSAAFDDSECVKEEKVYA